MLAKKERKREKKRRKMLRRKDNRIKMRIALDENKVLKKQKKESDL